MARIRILDPTAVPPEDQADPGPDAGALRGRRVEIRFDRTWQSFYYVKDEWQRSLVGLGAQVDEWEAGSRVGEEGEHTRAALDAFAERCEVAIVGLGN